MKQLKDPPQVLVYPEKPLREGEITQLSFAIDGLWTPRIIVINEEWLSDEVVNKIADDLAKIDYLEDTHHGDYVDERGDFYFQCYYEYLIYRKAGNYRVVLWEIDLNSSFLNELNIKCDYKKLKELIEYKLVCELQKY